MKKQGVADDKKIKTKRASKKTLGLFEPVSPKMAAIASKVSGATSKKQRVEPVASKKIESLAMMHHVNGEKKTRKKGFLANIFTLRRISYVIDHNWSLWRLAWAIAWRFIVLLILFAISYTFIKVLLILASASFAVTTLN